ncbi:uncharacterized protein LOC110708986 [Chenopodium quinoa]|uniref:uncharacterized protein LOC110708986 n=1 Tax=Chenopodium quinoa TaxID=63459 RepID=UPI000B78FFD3|nr:uncharacterized protein LOC110708986 [Chenopodium quinoa]
MLEKLLAKCCVKFERKRVGLWVLFSFVIVTISLCTVLKSYMDPQSIWEINLKRLNSNNKNTVKLVPHDSFEPFLAPMCNFSGEKSDYCEFNGDIRIHGNSSSIFFNSPQLENIELQQNRTWGIKIYARKIDEYVMGQAKELKLKPVSSVQEMPKCTVNHSVPAIVFSTGGYGGNIFHDTSDILIPLYLTSLHFNREVQFLIQDKHYYWNERHKVTLKALSKYEIIDLDHDKEIRCFNNAIIGVKSHRDFGIDPEKLPYGLTLRNYTQFTRKIYSLQRDTAIQMTAEDDRKPRLLIISRKKTRTILNENEIVAEAQRLGYDVVVIDARMNLKNFSKIVNSADVMLGVHGAGLTNILYLPENAVLIQVIPIGLQSVSEIFYERPARNMSLKYLEYEISVRESSLIQQYPIKHQVITDPEIAKKAGWPEFKKIYLDNQDVRLDMRKFRTVLVKALELLRQ